MKTLIQDTPKRLWMTDFAIHYFYSRTSSYNKTIWSPGWPQLQKGHWRHKWKLQLLPDVWNLLWWSGFAKRNRIRRSTHYHGVHKVFQSHFTILSSESRCANAFKTVWDFGVLASTTILTEGWSFGLEITGAKALFTSFPEESWFAETLKFSLEFPIRFADPVSWTRLSTARLNEVIKCQ